MNVDLDKMTAALDLIKANRATWWGAGLTGNAVAVNSGSKKMEDILRYLLANHLKIRDFAKYDPIRNSTYSMYERLVNGVEAIAAGRTPPDDITKPE
jgi:hypothetical protein